MQTLSFNLSDFSSKNYDVSACISSGIVFIDPKVDDYETLIAGVSPGLEVVLLDGSCDGISQITEALKGRRGLSSLHIVAHGEAGKLWLGKGFVNSNTLEEYKQDLRSWGEALAPDADILLYGCKVAASLTGEQFVRQLGKLTGADVAASRNLTGSSRLGGDWELEVKTGKIQSPLAFLAETMEVYGAVFATNRVSVSTGGTQGNGYSYSPSISSDGRYVTFTSYASNLVSGDTNNTDDVFVYDTQTNTTTRVSVGAGGTQGNNYSYSPSISADGRYVTFTSAASNLVSGDTNNTNDIFVYDTQANTTSRVSVGDSGTQANGTSYNSSISADGSYVAFYSEATNLVSGDTNGIGDIFVYDRQNNTTSRVSVGLSGTQSNNTSFDASISADGRYVAFYSYASNLVSGDTNNTSDIFLYDRQNNTTKRVSVANDGTQANYYSYGPSISADGRYVAFYSYASNLVSGDTNNTSDIFLYDTQTNTTKRISVANDGTQGNSYSSEPSISADGRYVTFTSYSSNLVSGDTNNTNDVFVYDTQTNTISRVSVSNDGTQGNGYSYGPSISADGSYVAFSSDSNNLVSGDTNSTTDVFVYARGSGTQNPWTGTPGNDSYTYTGSSAFAGYGLAGNDTITGGIGNDTLVGGEGNDSLRGLGGNDILNGGPGNDSMAGGTGDDTYLVDSTGDVVTENLNEGTDTVYSSISYTLGANVENLTLTGSSNITGTGNSLNNVITGNSGNNTLFGDSGFDTLEGGDGNDYLFGGSSSYIYDTSNDSLSGGTGNDTLVGGYGADTLEGGDGDDYLYGASYSLSTRTNDSLSGGNGNDYLSGGYSDDTLDGGDGNDTIYGYEGNDSVIGGAGNDYIVAGWDYNYGYGDDNDFVDGGEGNDTISGGYGNDSIYGGYGSDSLSGGDGDDYLDAGTPDAYDTASNSLSGGSGNDTLIGGSAADTLNGDDGNDSLDGYEGNDSLNGGAGNDTLDGGAGNDTMSGGAGNDIYYVDSASDVVTENLNEGTDTVYSSISYSLGDNVENLTLTGTSNISGSGNSLNNVITGNSGNNYLYGGSGSDTLNGGDGDDYLYDYEGDNSLNGGAGNDTLYGGYGGITKDTMSGGAGNDIYYVDNGNDKVIENLNEGTDTVYSYDVSYTLSANVENLTLFGSSNINGTGNSLNNVIIGNIGNNYLFGDSGSDTLQGGEGNDYLFGGSSSYTYDTSNDSLSGGNGNDTLVGGYGADTVDGGDGDDYLYGSSYNYSNPTNDSLSGGNGNDYIVGGYGADTLDGGDGNDYLYGYDGNDSLIGGAGNDTLYGSIGNDTMSGGTGNDIYYVDSASDVVTENAKSGTDTVYSSISYTLGANVENLVLTGSAINGNGNTLNNYITGNSANNTLSGGAGNDTLDGSTGNDSMLGGTGNDFYYVDSTSDKVTENANEGTDTVYSSVNHVLSANVENLTLTGSAIQGVGNGLNNSIYGNTQANTLSGQAGNDKIYGGSGNDNINGNAGNDSLYGEDGNDFLAGEQGNDLLSGGNGDDVLLGYGNVFAEIDTLIGGAGADIFGVGVNFARNGGSGGLVGYLNDGNAGYAVIQDFDSTDKIELKGNLNQYTFRQENILGSSTLDTTIYYNGTGGLDLVGVIQDSTTVTSSNLLFFA